MIGSTIKLVTVENCVQTNKHSVLRKHMNIYGEAWTQRSINFIIAQHNKICVEATNLKSIEYQISSSLYNSWEAWSTRSMNIIRTHHN